MFLSIVNFVSFYEFVSFMSILCVYIHHPVKCHLAYARTSFSILSLHKVLHDGITIMEYIFSNTLLFFLSTSHILYFLFIYTYAYLNLAPRTLSYPYIKI